MFSCCYEELTKGVKSVQAMPIAVPIPMDPVDYQHDIGSLVTEENKKISMWLGGTIEYVDADQFFF